jgi:dienelactone hydrolase
MADKTICCPTDRTAAASTGEYVAQGQKLTLNSMDVYSVGPVTASRVLVVVYDIFGFHYNNFELADVVAASKGWRVLVPDLFRGAPWPACHFPPRGKAQCADFSNFLSTQANSVDRCLDVKSLIASVASEHPQSDGQGFCYVLGFCWGAKVASLVNDYPGVRAIAGAHPSFLGATDALDVAVPTLWLPTVDDDLTDYVDGLKAGRGTQRGLVTIDEAFRDMFHGFLAARGDRTHEFQRQRASDAIKTIVAFFGRH